MSLTGVVVPGSPQSPGGTLLSDVASTDTVLEIDDAADFAEDFDEARYLVIGSETVPRAYVAVQNDEDTPPESVTLASPVGGTGLEAGLPVTPWDPNADADDKRAVNFRVWVRLDGFAEDASPVPAWVEQNRIPTASDYTLEGARVELTEDDDGDFWIERVLGRTGAVDISYVSNPNIGRLEIPAAQSIPTGGDVISPWVEDGSHPDLVSIGTSGVETGLVTLAAGTYLVIVTVRFATGTGVRRITLTKGVGLSLEDVAESRVVAATSANISLQVSGIVRCGTIAGRIKVVAYQDSGGSIDVFADGTQMQFIRLG